MEKLQTSAMGKLTVMECCLTQQPSSPVTMDTLLLVALLESANLMASGLEMHHVWVSFKDEEV